MPETKTLRVKLKEADGNLSPTLRLKLTVSSIGGEYRGTSDGHHIVVVPRSYEFPTELGEVYEI